MDDNDFGFEDRNLRLTTGFYTGVLVGCAAAGSVQYLGFFTVEN
jgi:hypothetical protein